MITIKKNDDNFFACTGKTAKNYNKEASMLTGNVQNDTKGSLNNGAL